MAKAKISTGTPKSPLDIEMEKIEKQYGVGTIVGDARQELDIISSGSLKLDIATSIGGYARGKVHEFMGWESCGKTTATLHAFAEAQKLGLRALLIDGEQSFDYGYAESLGVNVDPDHLTIFQMDEGGGEKAYDIAERLLKTGGYGICVFDSQTALLPKKILDDSNDASNLGLHARLMSRVVLKFVTIAANYNVAVIFISQFREKIGVMYGNPETTNGGNALKMYAHMRLTFRKSVINDADKNAKCVKVSVKINKNKLGIPYNTTDFNINFGEGIDKVLEIFDVAVDMGIITKAGSWFSYKGTQLGQGEDKVIQMLRDNPIYADNLRNLIIKELKAKKDAQASANNGSASGELPESTETVGDDSRGDTELSNDLDNGESDMETVTGETETEGEGGLTIVD